MASPTRAQVRSLSFVRSLCLLLRGRCTPGCLVNGDCSCVAGVFKFLLWLKPHWQGAHHAVPVRV